MMCLSEGTFEVFLLSLHDDFAFGSTLITDDGSSIETTTTDITVHCVPEPTPTPTATATATSTPALAGIGSTGINSPHTVDNLWICKGGGFPNVFAGPSDNLPPGQSNRNQLVIAQELSFYADRDTCNDDDDSDGKPCAGVPGVPPAPFQDQNDGCLVDAENYIPGQTAVDCDDDQGGINGTGELAEGLGAFEFQVKYDHKLFQQPEFDCDSGLLGDTGRIVQETVSVITENWTLFGCVSKSPEDIDGNPIITPGVNPPQGIAGYLTVTIQPDLFQRIRPTKDNGVLTDLLDENCEIADIYGMPFPGSIQGGLTPDCGDATITIRMLEGDINLDCIVDIVDDQQMAYRYGSFFGNLLYNRFFDLEPNIAPDFDIDIKDLQTVFGRNGSTCAEPIPDQVPHSPVPDP